jgi:hypothetical protein
MTAISGRAVLPSPLNVLLSISLIGRLWLLQDRFIQGNDADNSSSRNHALIAA